MLVWFVIVVVEIVVVVVWYCGVVLGEIDLVVWVVDLGMVIDVLCGKLEFEFGEEGCE